VKHIVLVTAHDARQNHCSCCCCLLVIVAGVKQQRKVDFLLGAANVMAQFIHPSILDPIHRIQHQFTVGGGTHQDEHQLEVGAADNVDRQSVQYLADFLSGDAHKVTELVLCFFSLLQPSDVALNVLCDLFANGNSTITSVELLAMNFGTAEEASQLIAAVQSNRLITDLSIGRSIT
jgi:hypothetical protein